VHEPINTIMFQKCHVKHFLFLTALLGGCASGPQLIKLTPVANGVKPPETCKITTVLPTSPAETAGLKPGDVVISANDVKPHSVQESLELIRNSGPNINLKIARDNAEPFKMVVKLNDKPPRLGITCDLGGAQILGTTPDGHPYIETSDGLVDLSATASIYNGITFVRVGVRNLSDHPINTNPGEFSAADGNRVMMAPMLPSQVQYALHGDVGANMVAIQNQIAWANAAGNAARANATYTTNASAYSYGNYAHGTATTSPDPGSQFASSFYNGYAMGAAIRAQRELNNAQADAVLLNRETLLSITVNPTFLGGGLIYFPQPNTFPLMVMADIEGHKFTFTFNSPQ